MLQQPVGTAREPVSPTAEPDLVRLADTPRPVRVPRQRQSYAGPEVIARSERARRAMLVPVVLCGVALLAGAATLGAVAVASSQHTSHTFRLPDSAGTLRRESDAGTEVDRRLAQAEQGFRTQFGGRLESVVSATYRNASPATGRPSGSLVFLGAAMDTSGDPDDFVNALGSTARRAGYRVTTVSAGPGAHGACLSTNGSAVTCAWSTGDSVGEVVPTGSGWDVASLATQMRALRTTAERSTGAA